MRCGSIPATLHPPAKPPFPTHTPPPPSSSFQRSSQATPSILRQPPPTPMHGIAPQSSKPLLQPFLSFPNLYAVGRRTERLEGCRATGLEGWTGAQKDGGTEGGGWIGNRGLERGGLEIFRILFVIGSMRCRMAGGWCDIAMRCHAASISVMFFFFGGVSISIAVLCQRQRDFLAWKTVEQFHCILSKVDSI